MSENILVKVNCHHSGLFKTENGYLNYIDGEIDVLEVDSCTIVQDVMIVMLEKRRDIGRMWYKLPFEEVTDRKPLWENVDANNKKLVAAGRWIREIDIYVENKEAEAIVEENLSDEEDDKTYGAGDESEIENSNAGTESEKSDGGLSESEDSDDEVEMVEEDIGVLNNEDYEEQIIDEDEIYPATDNSSGDEEEQAERLAKRGLLDGVFSLKQFFCSGSDFKKNVIRYILKTRRNIVFDRWEKTKVGAKCKAKGCGWRIYCSVEIPIGKWMVKVYEDEHQCSPTGRCELIKSPVIADLFLEDIRRDPTISAPEIKDEMKKRYNIIVSPNQAKVARRRVFDKLQAECDEQFARLRDYELQLIESNEFTTVEINTKTRDDGSEAFSQMYVCFEPLKSSWKQNCRPIIGLDGTFLKHSMNGMMLTAVGRDPNNQIYPIAWAVVDVENNDNWEWFIHNLKKDLNLELGENVSIISDMHKGLIHGVSTQLPKAEHRACARHIYSNLKKLHKSETLKPLFWRVASSYNKADFKTNLQTFRDFDPQACDDLLKKDHHTWCRAFFRVSCCCADTHNNHTESFNRTLKIARNKPFVQMLELIRRDAMQRIANRCTIAGKETAKHTKKARKELEKSCEEAQHCYMISSTGGTYEIVEFDNGYSVSLRKRTCACRKWDLTGIPCRHAVCAIRENNLEVEDYVSDYYLTSKWQDTYKRGLGPVNGHKFWKNSGRVRIVAPPYKRPPGRPKGKARIKGFNESPQKKKKEKKVGREGREMHCGLCGEKGHNSRRCSHESQESRAKRMRLNEETKSQRDAEVNVEDVSSTAPTASQFEMLMFG